MSDKEEENEKNEPKSTIGPGDLLSFGSVNLLFTLTLEKDDLKNYKTTWDELKSLANLKFISSHKHFWKKVELSSKNSTINLLLQINQSSKKLIKIAYVGFKRITYKDEQVNFYDFIESVTTQNGLFITSCDVCKCTISIQLLLKYKNKQKVFVLSGVSTPIENYKNENNDKNGDNKNETMNNDKNDDKKDDKNDEIINEDMKKEKENKSEEEDQDNPLTNITDDVINPNDYNYIYFNFSDFSSGEFNGRIKIEHLYEYFQNLKINTKSKIILNLNDEIINKNDENIKNLLSITDIFIFYNKSKLYDILKQMKEQEDENELKKIYEYHYNKTRKKIAEKEENKEKEKEYIENYKNFLEKEKIQKNKRSYNTVKKERTRQKIYITQNTEDPGKDKINQLINVTDESQEKINIKTIDTNKARLKIESSKNDNKNKIATKSKSNSINIKNLKIKLNPLKPSHPKPLDKREMFDYFKCGICDKDPQKKTQDKIALVLDEFKKLFFIKFNKKEEKPSVLDFDLNLYPQMNIRNMNEILESKKFIQSNFNDYSKTFFGTLLSTIVSKGQEGCEEKSLFLAYLVAMNTIKKMVEIQKNDLPMPKSKDFFSPSIKKGEIKRLLTEANQRKKEKLFILDGNTKTNIGIKPYNPLLDKNLASFFSTKNNQLFLKINGFIGKNGEIMYDPLYRDTLNTLNNTNLRYNKNISNLDKNLIYNSVERKKNNKANSNHKKIKFKSMTTNKFLFGFRKKSPGYSIYNESRKNTLVLPFISPEKRKRMKFMKNKFRNNKNEKEIEEIKFKKTVGDDFENDN